MRQAGDSGQGRASLERDLAAFDQGLEQLGIDLEADQRHQFLEFRQVLLSWNERMNLVSRRDAGSVLSRHALTSLIALSLIRDTDDGEVMDVGSGGGFPGIPLKICLPRTPITLVESSRKKALFLQHAVQELGLSGINVLNERAEMLCRDPAHGGRYVSVTVRAVAHLKEVIRLSLPLLAPGGRLLAFKGRTAEAEAKESSASLEKWGGRIVGIEEKRGLRLSPRPKIVIVERV